MREEMQPMREEMRQMHEKMQQMRAEIERLEQRLAEYNAVRLRKRACLTEMLTTRFGIQPIITTPVQDEALYQEGDPVALVDRVSHWMSYYSPLDMTNCDINARACWATLSGNKNRSWVRMHSSDKRSGFIEASITEWNAARQRWNDHDTHTRMIVRFVATDNAVDGHTVVSYKYRGHVGTFQAYHDVCPLTYLNRDIFAGTSPLVQKLLDQEPVCAVDFGVVGSGSDPVPLKRQQSYHAHTCFYWME